MIKKFKTSILMAAAILLGFSSCNTELDGPDPIGPDGPGTTEMSVVSFTLSVPGTRAIGDTQGAHPVYLESGVILLSNGTNILYARQAASVIDGATETFELVPAGITRAHFVGNTDLTGIDGVDAIADLVGLSLADVLTHPLTVNSQMQRNAEDMNPGSANLVNVYRSGLLEQDGERQTVIDGVPTTVTVWTVTLPLEPTVARLELFNVTGNAQIAGFNLHGVFVDRFYREGQVGFGGVGWRELGERDESQYDFGASDFTAANQGVFFDWHGATGVQATAVPNVAPHTDRGTAGLMRVTPGATPNIVWGYNLFAGAQAIGAPGAPGAVTGTRTPALAIRLTNVTVNASRSFEWSHEDNGTITDREMEVEFTIPHPMRRTDNSLGNDPAWVLPTLEELNTWYEMPGDAGEAALIAHMQGQFTALDIPLFVSIRGFRVGDAAPNFLTGFEPRHVYQIGGYHGDGTDGDGGSWTFGPDDLDTVPFRRAIDVQVTIQVQNWIPRPVDPIL